MRVIEYFKSKNQSYWREEIGKSDWSAGTLLYRHLKSGDFKTVCGETAEVLLLCEGRELISFCIYAERDDNGITDPSMTPWAGFVYTFPEHRGKRRIGKLLEYVCSLAKKDGHKRVYISTSETGLYEKYACTFLKMMTTAKGEKERVYVMDIPEQNYTDVLGKVVSGTADRPMGTAHPDYPDMVYPVNYGFLDGVFAKDGEAQDVYILGVDHPVKRFTGKVAAVWHRLNDVEDKWIVSVNGQDLTPEEIVEAIAFQEQYFMGELYLPQKAIMVETKRLKIYPASLEQMETLIAAEDNEELRTAYKEMLEGSLAHPDQREWYAIWMIELKNGTHIGDLCFKGLINGVAEIGYGISEEYQNQGYATEAVDAAVNWALKHSGVMRIEAETDPDNAASRRVLEKCGFIPTGSIGEEGPRFVFRGTL